VKPLLHLLLLSVADCRYFCSVIQKSMLEMAVEEYAVEITQKALDKCHLESHRLVFSHYIN